MAIKRLAGNVKINSVNYRIFKQQNGQYTYERRSVPKINLSAQTRRALAGQSNMLEYTYAIDGGYGDSIISKRDNAYHYGLGMYFEHDQDITMLPGYQYVTTKAGEAALELSNPPVGTFELYSDRLDILTTYIIQDCKAMVINQANDAEIDLTINKTFEGGCVPSDCLSFNNVGYVAMGTRYTVFNILSVANNGSGKFRATTDVAHNLAVNDIVRVANSSVAAYNGLWQVSAVGSTTTFDLSAVTYSASATARCHKNGNRYLRQLKGGTWSADKNNYQSVTAVADSGVANTTTTGNRPRFACTSHGYVAGDVVQLVNFTVAAYNSMSTAEVSTLYTVTNASDANHFDVEGITVGATATGLVNKTDSDVLADQLVVAGDLLVRAYLDPTLGWVTSRVDPIASSPLLDANWTAGIGTVGVGDVGSPITDMVAIGDGEIVMKAEGCFVYNQSKGAYFNAVPELEEHRHPENGRGAVMHKGWVYVPTVIGLLRYRNGAVQNVTPGKDGQQSFETPIGPIGALAGDVERLYAITRPFRVNQPKMVVSPQTAMAVDTSNAGDPIPVSDWSLDPELDLTGLTSTGYLYVGSTQPWHRMHLEVDPVNNTLAYSLSGLKISTAQYWNGTAWTTRSGLIDYTRIRDTSAKFPSSFAQSGDLLFTSEMPTDWATGGAGAGGLFALSSVPDGPYYWCRFQLSASVGAHSVILKRAVAGIHVAAVTMTPSLSAKELPVDHGGVQYILSLTEDQRGMTWRTMWGWKAPLTTTTDDNTSTTYTTGGAQPVGCLSVIQPNALRSAQGNRFLFAGLHHNSALCNLGPGTDPTEIGPYEQQYGGTSREYFVVFPDTDCGLPTITKTLQEVDFDLDGFTAADVEAFYRVDGGAWTSLGNASTLPIKTTAGSEPAGIHFGLAISLGVPADAKAVNLPRIHGMPVLRFQPHPDMAEIITMTVELEPDEMLPGQIDRRSAATAYAALTSLQTNNVSVAYTDVDESTDHVHVLQLTKHVEHNANNEPRVVADIILAVVP